MIRSPLAYDFALLLFRPQIGRISGAMNTQQIVEWVRQQLAQAPTARRTS